MAPRSIRQEPGPPFNPPHRAISACLRNSGFAMMFPRGTPGAKAALPISRGVMNRKIFLQTVVACVVLALRLASSHGDPKPQGSIVGWGGQDSRSKDFAEIDFDRNG